MLSSWGVGLLKMECQQIPCQLRCNLFESIQTKLIMVSIAYMLSHLHDRSIHTDIIMLSIAYMFFRHYMAESIQTERIMLSIAYRHAFRTYMTESLQTEISAYMPFAPT